VLEVSTAITIDINIASLYFAKVGDCPLQFFGKGFVLEIKIDTDDTIQTMKNEL
jgi:hypothetical protein